MNADELVSRYEQANVTLAVPSSREPIYVVSI